MLNETTALIFLLVTSVVSIIFGIFNIFMVMKVSLNSVDDTNTAGLMTIGNLSNKLEDMRRISKYIADGATTFLLQQYKFVGIFAIIFAIVLFFAAEEKIGHFWTTGAFILGAVTSIISGFIGMKIAVVANVRTTKEASKSIGHAFIVAYRAGSVLGFILVGLGLLMLTGLMFLYLRIYNLGDKTPSHYQSLFESIAGYGLGGSTIALFGRVGGGIYTKAADVGADLVGKVIKDLDEDSPKNPGVIADNVGDNVGDIAGMGSDLFGSFAESSCAALVVSATSIVLTQNPGTLYYPLMITGSGIIVSIVTSFFATNIIPIHKDEHVERSLKYQLLISTVLMTPTLIVLAYTCLPADFELLGVKGIVHNYHTYICSVTGLWSGLIIGFITEYFTSNTYKPVRDIAGSCRTGAATNIIYGLALGYLSTIIPIIALAATICVSFLFCGMYGVALAALGMLSTLSIALTIDAYGPISDNAGGIAEICELEGIRERTDVLDAAGNTTAAIGKGFAIGSACLVALALFGAFVTRTNTNIVNILSPLEFSGLIIGAMLPYAFSALTMKSVGSAAMEMIEEIKRQMEEKPGILTGEVVPDYNRCIAISTSASLKEMIAPGLLVIVTPFVVGAFFGPRAVSGLLAGAIVSGVQMAIAFSNSGGAWDNAKKYIEADKFVVNGEIRGKKTEEHKAAVIGDTVGDPLKDTSGPSLNILIKLMAIISLVFGSFFVNTGGFLAKYFD